MKIKDIMTGDPAVCTRDTSLEEVAKLMVDCDCGLIPVVESEQSMRPIGAITDRDIVVRLLAKGKNPLECKVEAAMTRDCVTASMDSELDEAIELMENNQIRRLMIVDEDDVLCGVVSQADIARQDRDLAGEVVERVSQPSA
ncbi:MAG: CBS domain-containing protein [Bradymonadaceae bacterium]